MWGGLEHFVVQLQRCNNTIFMLRSSTFAGRRASSMMVGLLVAHTRSCSVRRSSTRGTCFCAGHVPHVQAGPTHDATCSLLMVLLCCILLSLFLFVFLCPSCFCSSVLVLLTNTHSAHTHLVHPHTQLTHSPHTHTQLTHI